jgi:hypothetical protein
VIAVVFVLDPDHPNRPSTLIVLFCAQNFAIIAWLAMVARRKGTGSLRSDFGLQIRRPATVHRSDAPRPRRAVAARRRCAGCPGSSSR